MVKLEFLVTTLGAVFHREDTVTYIFGLDVLVGGTVLAAKGFEQASPHNSVKVVQNRHICRQPVVIVQSANFRIEFAYDLCVRHIDELSSVGWLPYLFSVRALFDIHRSEFQQLIEPLFMGEIQLDLSVPVTFEISVFITGVILAS